MIIKVDRKKIETSIERSHEVIKKQKEDLIRAIDEDSMANAMTAMTEIISSSAYIDAMTAISEGYYNEDCECKKGG